MTIVSGAVAYIVYTTYQKYKQNQSSFKSNYSISGSLSTSWRDVDAVNIPRPSNMNSNKVITPSMKKFRKQTGFQKHGSKASDSQLLTASRFALSQSSLQSTNTDLTELAPVIRQRPFLLTRQATKPELDLSPTFLGESSYRETVIFLLALAVNRLFPDQELIVQNTFKFGTSRRSYFCSFSRSSGFIFNEENLKQIEQEMKELSNMQLELQSKFVDYNTCFSMLTSTNQLLSARLVQSLNRPCYRMVGCDMNDDTSYYILQYRSTLNNTKYCSRFRLHQNEDNKYNFVIKFPHKEDEMDDSKESKMSLTPAITSSQEEKEREAYKQPKAIRELFKNGNEMSQYLEVNSVADINDVIRIGRFKELMLVSEAYHNRQIVKISNKINNKSNDKQRVKMILISGPSSSGKTTFASKLGIQLRLLGMVPTVLEVDMFYRDRSDPIHPRDSHGNPNFEVLGAIKVKEFNDTINRLLDGQECKIPNFDFKTGARNGYQKEPLRLDKDNGVLIMEGIFCLNPELLSNVKDVEQLSFKIFICPISPFYALDNLHFISEQVMRLIRRISRDHFHRGKDADQVVFKWGQLKEGEDINIFPYVKYADAVFNSSLLYEISVLKTYSYPLLQTVEKKSPQYKDAQNLIAFLDMFFSMPDRHVPSDSLLMEFIGKSIFDEM